MEIAEWAREHFRKLSSVITVQYAIQKFRLKVCHSTKKSNMNMIQKHRHLLSANARSKWTEAQWKTSFWRTWSSSGLRRRVSICIVINAQLHAIRISLMLWKQISNYGICGLHIWKGTINAPRYICRIQTNICSRPDVFFWEDLAYLSKAMLNLTVKLFQQRCFIVKESGC